MKLSQGHAPFWKHNDSLRLMRADLLLCSALMLVPQLVRFGFRPLLLAVAAGLAGMLTEFVFCLLMRRDIMITDLDSFSIGVLIALLMPANIAFYVPAIAVVFAVAVAKLPFGDTGRAPLSPVAAGMAFAVLCFPDVIFLYADVNSGIMSLNIFEPAQVIAAQSPAALLHSGARPELLKPELMVGSVVGPMGTTGTFLTAAAALYLFFRRTANARVTVCWMLAASLVAALLPRVSTGRFDSVMLELSTGSLAFYAAMVATDRSIAPKLPLAQCLYGFFGGLLTMAFRYGGVYEQGGCFAVLLINAVAPILDRVLWRFTRAERRMPTHEKASGTSE